MPMLTAPDSLLVFVRRLSSLVERRKRVVLAEEGRGRGDMIDDLRALLPARAGDEFQTSEPSEEVPNPIDEHPEEEQ